MCVWLTNALNDAAGLGMPTLDGYGAAKLARRARTWHACSDLLLARWGRRWIGGPTVLG